MQETASLSRIRPGKNPREFFDEAELNELAESIRSYGVLHPMLVRPRVMLVRTQEMRGDCGT